MSRIRNFVAPAAAVLILGLATFSAGQRPPVDTTRGVKLLKTPGEEAGYTAYTQNEAIAAFLSRLAVEARDTLSVSVVGRSLPSESYGARDIFLVTLAPKGSGGPGAAVLDPAKPTVLFTAAQHGNEQSAKEAVLRLVRDLAVGPLRPLLAKVNVVAMPQMNPYGNFINVRANELDLDLNRDHVKLEAEGVRAIHRVFRAFRPEVTIDVHEKGDDYYRVSIGCVSNVNIGRDLQDFSRGVILAEVEAALKNRKIAFHEYLVTEDLGVDTSSGASRPDAASGPREEMKRYSTTDLNDGRNSLGIFETLSFIQEGASRHDLETLAARTEWQYQGLRAFLESVAGHAPEILRAVRGDRARLLERAAVRAENDPVHLRMTYVRDPAVPELRLRRFERLPGPAAAGRDRRPPVVDEVVKHWFPNVEPTLSVPRPRGYIIRGTRLDIVDTLLALGVEVGMFSKDAILETEVYEVGAVEPSDVDYEAPKKIDVTLKPTRTPVYRGDFYVDAVQPAANLVPCLLEPQSAYGFIRYWKFKLAPEAGGLYEIARYAGKDVPPVIPYRPWRP